jgi:surfeit locus 1 family protein
VSILATLPKLVSRRWWLPTIIIILGAAVLIRLGIWQIDRMHQKQALNMLMSARWQQEPFDLNSQALPSDLGELEFRHIAVQGKFDYDHQILLSHQSYNEAPGSIIVTPLVLDDKHAVLVARGWLPSGEDTPENWAKYEEPADAPVIGLAKESQLLPNGQAPTPPPSPQTEWYQINVAAIQPQMPYQLLPVIIQQLPQEGRTTNDLPIREEPLPFDESMHFGYAIQWYCFALVLAGGYILFVRSQELRDQRNAGTLQDGAAPENSGDTEIVPISQQEGHA